MDTPRSSWRMSLTLGQALNTVLAFCSSRKSMAPTFDSIRGSVENLLKGWVPQIDTAGQLTSDS